MQDIINRPIPLFFQTGYLTIKDYIYIIEIKIDNTADAALQQIEDWKVIEYLTF